jgi:hypothetical protein
MFSNGFHGGVTDPGLTTGNLFHQFEGFWVATRPSGAVAIAKVINEKLLIPYSYGQGKLSGHYYDCRVVELPLFCRFEPFDSALKGVMFLELISDETLKGGRWLNDTAPDVIRKDIVSLSESVPGMQPVVWVRMKKKIPQWAEKYFIDDDWHK